MKSRSIVKRDLRNWKLYRAGQARGRQERVRGRGESAPLAREILCLPTNYQEPTRENEGYLKARSAEGRDRRKDGGTEGGTALKAPLKKRLDRLEAWMGRPSVRPSADPDFLPLSLSRSHLSKTDDLSLNWPLFGKRERAACDRVRVRVRPRFVWPALRRHFREEWCSSSPSLPPPDRPLSPSLHPTSLAPLSHISPSQSIRTNR